MYTSGSRDFAAYAQNLRRGHMAGLLEHGIEARRPQRDIFDLMFGGELASLDRYGERPVVRGRAPRGPAEKP
jgi:hypothetical protein